MRELGYIRNLNSDTTSFSGSVFTINPGEYKLISDISKPISYLSIKEDRGSSLYYDQNGTLFDNNDFIGCWYVSFINSMNTNNDSSLYGYFPEELHNTFRSLTGSTLEDTSDKWGEKFKIYQFLSDDSKNVYGSNEFMAPHSVDYKKDLNRKLIEKNTFKKGYLVSVEYFENIQISGYTKIYTNPILKELMQYHIGVTEYLDYRITRRYWQKNSGEYSLDYKETIKYYDSTTTIAEAKIRRGNIINDIVTTSVGLISMTTASASTIPGPQVGVPFFDECDSSVEKFIKGNINPLINLVSTSNSHTWLNNLVPGGGGITIRQLILSKMSSGYLSAGEIIEPTGGLL